MKKIMIILVLTIALVASAIMAAEVSKENKVKEKIITQGEFAILYCEAVGLTEPANGWTADSAINALKGLKPVSIAPENGWQSGKDLLEGEMVYLVQPVGINLVTAYPAKKVLYRRAVKVFIKFKEMFLEIHPEHRNLNEENATYVQPLGNPSQSSF